MKGSDLIPIILDGGASPSKVITLICVVICSTLFRLESKVTVALEQRVSVLSTLEGCKIR